MHTITTLERDLDARVEQLQADLDRIRHSLQLLRAVTLTLVGNVARDCGAVDQWFATAGFVNVGGYLQQQVLLDRLEHEQPPLHGQVAVAWQDRFAEDQETRFLIYAHRGIAQHIGDVRAQLGAGVDSIYFQSPNHLAITEPTFGPMHKLLPPDFDWTTYHSFVSAGPRNNPERQLVFSEPHVDYATVGPIIVVSLPVFSGDEFVGLWSLDLRLSAMTESVTAADPAPGQSVFITDSRGRLLSHTSDGLFDGITSKGATLHATLTDLGGDFPSLDAREVAMRERSAMTLRDASGALLSVACRPVGELGWVVWSCRPARDLVDGMKDAFEDAFARVRGGDLAHRLEVPGTNREFGSVADAYNEMVATLQHNQAQLKTALDEAKAATDAESRFVAVVSHELRTPLNSLLNVPYLFLEDIDENAGVFRGDARELAAGLRRIGRNAKHLRTLVENILVRSSVDAGKVRPDITRFNLDDLMVELHDHVRDLATAADIELAFDNPPESIVMHADFGQLKRVLINLVGNAIKFTETGGSVRIHSRGEQDTIALEVSDDGIGIDPSQHQAIFEPYYAGHQGPNPSQGGTGLGLSVVKDLVELHGGETWVTSRPGAGSTFHVALPRTQMSS